MAGIGQFGGDQLPWSQQYALPTIRKGTAGPSDLSPGARKGFNILGIKKKMYEEDDLDAVNQELYMGSSIFGKDSFGSSSLYGQPGTVGGGGGGSSLSVGGLSSLQQSQQQQQQAQRGLGSQHITRGFSSTSIPGHVTPTNSGIPSFPGGMTNSLPPQQPSPNRNVMAMSSRGILGQPMNREVKRTFPGNMNMAGLGLVHSGRGFSSQGMVGGGLQSMGGSFGAGGSSDNPPALDLSEFPSLNNRAGGGSSLSNNPMVGRPAYVGMVKQPTSDSNEFQIHSEDFPALPGSQVQEPTTTSSSNGSNDTSSKNVSLGSLDSSKDGRFNIDKGISQGGGGGMKRGIQTSPDGKVTNIPASMVNDPFGMVGLLTFIRAAETDPNLVSLALGSDLTTLGLNLNSPDNLYPTFSGPFSDVPCRPQDIDYHNPVEYLTNTAIKEKLASVKLSRYGDDLLFYLFYSYGCDVLQLAAAAELYSRDWRFHKEERVWVTRAPGMAPMEKTATYERGTYYFYDTEKWRRTAKEFHLDYDKLEDKPLLPLQFSQVHSLMT
ncbi:hypothetical protein CHUAL_008893 [Chamberlinius hualienensis]